MKRIFLSLFVFFTFLFSNDFDTALGYYQSKNYAKALPLLEFLCEQSSSAKSCFLLGYMYENGEGVSYSQDTAQRYYELSCDKKLSNACFNLALILESKDDIKNSRLNLYKACSLEHLNACKGLGMIYDEEKDGELALEFYKRACDLQDANSCLRMGFLYRNGDIVKQNTHLAQKAYTKACDLKDAKSCFVLAEFYLSEKNNRSAAKSNFGKSCDLGFSDGCVEYKKLLDNNISN
ncbi:tetratricopeptide repeat protein [uncultured Campylobacter sp.]|uniref:tetratricopeptide repeat protein n=1 Tax=uncultured Campylobacter sp. TaxID=218934 RepID=UPI0026366C7D|nr:tetratricopeptide repeat protein [uncultured Campylobacter sp.]